MEDSTTVEFEAAESEGLMVPDDAEISVEVPPLYERLRPGSDLHGRLLSELNRRFRRSKTHIEQRYDDWNHVDRYMRLYLDLSAPARNSDKSYDSRKKEHPYKRGIAIPLMYHVIMTRMAFLYSHFMSADPFVHLEAVSSDGWRKSRLMEARLNKDVRATNNNLHMYQLLFDNERYGLGAWKLSFEETWRPSKAKTYYSPEELMQLGMDPEEEIMTLAERGNRWRAVDPRCLILDPEMAAGRAREGEYVGDWRSVNWLSLNSARFDREEGPYINVDEARKLKEGGNRDHSDGRDVDGGFSSGDARTYPTLEVYTMQWRIIPLDFDLSESERPEVWEFAVANEEIIVRAHKIEHGRGGFTYYIGQGDPDMHAPFTSGMGQMLIGMQQSSNFLATSHYVNARQAVNNRSIINDDLVRAADWRHPSANQIMRLTREGKILNKRGMDINAMYRQLQITDLTKGHLETLKYLTADAQRMASTPDTMQGMPLPTKRTLGEIENVNQSATVRLGITAQLIDAQVVEPCMMDAVENLQTKLDSTELVQLTGRLFQQLGNGETSVQPIDPSQLRGHYEYIPRTPTMAKDPARSATVWGQVMQILSTAPQLLNPMPDGLALNPHAVFNEFIRTLGVDYFDQFYFNTQPQQAQTFDAPRLVQPEQVDESVRKGDMVPLEEYLGG